MPFVAQANAHVLAQATFFFLFNFEATVSASVLGLRYHSVRPNTFLEFARLVRSSSHSLWYTATAQASSLGLL